MVAHLPARQCSNATCCCSQQTAIYAVFLASSPALYMHCFVFVTASGEQQGAAAATLRVAPGIATHPWAKYMLMEGLEKVGAYARYKGLFAGKLVTLMWCCVIHLLLSCSATAGLCVAIAQQQQHVTHSSSCLH
jgi:hypothetical protein